jgi:uncharacterized protein YgiM (DUF1202 family)
MRLSCLSVIATLFSAPGLALAQEYVVVTGESVNIRSGPGGAVVGQARSGDVFELQGREGEWFSILMFSGEYRSVHSSLVRASPSAPSQPSEAIRRRAFQAFVRAEDRATAEADRQILPTNLAAIERNIDLQRLLDDRYKLEVCHQFSVHAVHYNTLKVEGIRKGWIQ